MTLAKLSVLEAIIGFDMNLATIPTNEVDKHHIHAQRYKSISAGSKVSLVLLELGPIDS